MRKSTKKLTCGGKNRNVGNESSLNQAKTKCKAYAVEWNSRRKDVSNGRQGQ